MGELNWVITLYRVSYFRKTKNFYVFQKQTKQNQEKSLEDFLSEPDRANNPKHKLEVTKVMWYINVIFSFHDNTLGYIAAIIDFPFIYFSAFDSKTAGNSQI